MTAVAGGLKFVVPREPIRARLAVHSLIATAVVAWMASGVVIAEAVWGLHIRAASTSSAIETAIMVLTLISGVLLLSRFRQTRRLHDLLLLVGVTTVALTEVVFRALPALSNHQTGSFGTGARLACSLLVTGTLLAAAFSPARRLIAPHPWLTWLAGCAGICEIAVCEVMNRITGTASGGSSTVYEPLVITLAFVSLCGLLVAGFGFASRPGTESDGDRLVAGASYLLAGAAAEQLAMPLVPALLGQAFGSETRTTTTSHHSGGVARVLFATRWLWLTSGTFSTVLPGTSFSAVSTGPRSV